MAILESVFFSPPLRLMLTLRCYLLVLSSLVTYSEFQACLFAAYLCRQFFVSECTSLVQIKGNCTVWLQMHSAVSKICHIFRRMHKNYLRSLQSKFHSGRSLCDAQRQSVRTCDGRGGVKFLTVLPVCNHCHQIAAVGNPENTSVRGF